MLMCVLMTLSGVAFGTIAYLTDTAKVVNRFTVGNVDITVDETDVDENGNPVPNPAEDPENPDDDYLRTQEDNCYPMIPGSEYKKDPTMTVTAGSEPAYVRMLVTITNAAEIKEIFAQLSTQYENYAAGFIPNEHVTGWDSAVWNYFGATEDTTANTITLEFRYHDIVSAGKDQDEKLAPLFETIVIPGELTNAHLTKLEDFAIEVVGNAIQTKGFADADAAWAAFDAQMEAAGQANVDTTDAELTSGEATEAEPTDPEATQQ